LMDSPVEGGNDSGSEKAPCTSYIADIIDVLASEYGWSDELIMDLPWARLLQYIRAIEQRKAKERGATEFRLHNRYTTPLEREWMELDNEVIKLKEGTNA